MPGTYNDALLNDFAIRSFRDMADRDYIHARMAFKARLVPQFQWSALHSLEKYAKGILLLNRIPAKSLRHEVTGALKLLEEAGRFKASLSEQTIKFIERLEDGAAFRYFEVSYSSHAFDVIRLDCAVSELRRYCQVLDWEIDTDHGRRNLLQPMLNRIESAASSAHRDTCIMNGWLEGILRKADHPARAHLVWKNLYFGPSKRQSIRMVGYTESGNAPLYLHPEIIEEVVKYVFMPKSIAQMWREHLIQRKAEAGDA